LLGYTSIYWIYMADVHPDSRACLVCKTARLRTGRAVERALYELSQTLHLVMDACQAFYMRRRTVREFVSVDKRLSADCASKRATTRSSGCPVAEMPREYPKRPDQDALCLALSYRPSAPALPDRPLADAPLQAYDVPDPAPGRARDAAQRLHSLVNATAGVELADGGPVSLNGE
jgi:hypothetical protein